MTSGRPRPPSCRTVQVSWVARSLDLALELVGGASSLEVVGRLLTDAVVRLERLVLAAVVRVRMLVRIRSVSTRFAATPIGAEAIDPLTATVNLVSWVHRVVVGGSSAMDVDVSG